jgi:hypothetical protein
MIILNTKYILYILYIILNYNNIYYNNKYIKFKLKKLKMDIKIIDKY